MARTPEPTEFTVRGTGLFPFDMLRYDRCYPKSQEDTAAVERTTRRRASAPDAPDIPYFRVTMVSASPNAPTEARWESFGWNVVD